MDKSQKAEVDKGLDCARNRKLLQEQAEHQMCNCEPISWPSFLFSLLLQSLHTFHPSPLPNLATLDSPSQPRSKVANYKNDQWGATMMRNNLSSPHLISTMSIYYSFLLRINHHISRCPHFYGYPIIYIAPPPCVHVTSDKPDPPIMQRG